MNLGSFLPSLLRWGATGLCKPLFSICEIKERGKIYLKARSHKFLDSTETVNSPFTDKL